MTVNMEDKEPVDFFHLFFDGHILDLIHRETVQYIEEYLERDDEYLQAHPKARAHDGEWIHMGVEVVHREGEPGRDWTCTSHGGGSGGR